MSGTTRQKFYRWWIHRACDLSRDARAFAHARHPNLLDRLETLKTLLSTGKSVARVGDGELIICLSGREIPFQPYSKELADRLERILKEPGPGVLVCMNNAFMQSSSVPWILGYERSKKEYAVYESIRETDDIGMFSREKEHRHYNECYRILYGKNAPVMLGDATVFMLGLYVKEYREGRIEEVKELFRKTVAGKSLLIACPREPLMQPSFRSLEGRLKAAGATRIEYIDIPENDAFAHYGQIRERLLRSTGFDRVWIQAGPAATVLAHELGNAHDIPAYDIGSFNTTLQYII